MSGLGDFEGMSKEDFQFLAMQAQFFYLSAKTAVLQEILESLLKSAGNKEIDGILISDYIHQQIHKTIPKTLAGLSDTDPTMATQLTKMIEAIERGHI